MFEALLWMTFGVCAFGIWYGYMRSKDVFHPVMFIGPVLAFLYAWMPLRLHRSEELSGYFDMDQLLFVQTINLLGVIAFFCGCLSVDADMRGVPPLSRTLPYQVVRRLVLGGTIVGCIGATAWLVSIINVGGLYNAFSQPYSGGWDDSGYVRDGSILLLASILLLLGGLAFRRPYVHHVALTVFFTLPWLIQAILTSRRGPTFALAITIAFGWYLNRNRRPAIVTVALGGVCIGYLILFLVTNRNSIYLGSDRELTTDVTEIVEKPHTGNEYIYGAGSILSAERRDEYFWGRRYLAQVLVRPIPTAIWPNKYADFGVPELLNNAGTGEGIADTMGWVGAVGSAPGIVADLWIEGSWFAIPMMAVFGWCYAFVWRKALLVGKAWVAQYAILGALALYLVMQTMEAVIFRCLLLSIPVWLVWNWAMRAVPDEVVEPEFSRFAARSEGVLG